MEDSISFQMLTPPSAISPQVAEHCLKSAKDLSGLLLLYSARGSVVGLTQLTGEAMEGGKHNVAFLARFLLGDLAGCVQLLIASGRIAEAAFFARTYLPSAISEVCRGVLPTGWRHGREGLHGRDWGERIPILRRGVVRSYKRGVAQQQLLGELSVAWRWGKRMEGSKCYAVLMPGLSRGTVCQLPRQEG